MEYPGLLGNVSKCSIHREGTMQEVHLKYPKKQNMKDLYSMCAQCYWCNVTRKSNMGLIHGLLTPSTKHTHNFNIYILEIACILRFKLITWMHVLWVYFKYDFGYNALHELSVTCFRDHFNKVWNEKKIKELAKIRSTCSKMLEISDVFPHPTFPQTPSILPFKKITEKGLIQPTKLISTHQW